MAKQQETVGVMPARSALSVGEVDPDLAHLIQAEEERQEQHLELIASENHSCRAIMEATGSVLTDKYAEGYPGSRYYGGCECVDMVETLAIERAKRVFGADHANVQPHAGSQANMAVYVGMLSPGSKILGMSLSHGGHLTHGHHKNFSGQVYTVVNYGVDSDGLLDYDEVRHLAQEHNPSIIVAGASAYSRIINFETFRDVADEVGAFLMVDIAHIAGLIAGGVHPNPTPYADFVTGTTHKTLRGPRGGFVLCRREHARRLDSAVMPGSQGGPMMHVIAAKALCFKLAEQPEFRQYQQQIVANAAALCEECIRHGFSIVSGGTDTHLFLIDLEETGMSGDEACDLLALANITVNKNAIPNDRRKPSEAGGIRLGTPAVTTRGMKEAEMREIAAWVADILGSDEPEAAAARTRDDVLALCARFPIPR